MKRVRRRLFDIAAAVSLALCVATLTLWLAGRSYRFTIYRFRTPVTWSISTTTRGVVVGATRFSGPAAGPAAGEPQWQLVTVSATGPTLGVVRWEFLGFTASGFTHINAPSLTTRTNYFMVPFWFVVMVSGGLSASAVLAWWTRRGRRVLAGQGCCPACGYDLRATPERCPECGTPATTTPA
jgi:hypothetical protein